MQASPTPNEPFAALSAHLAARRPLILEAWRARTTHDPQLTTVSALSRTQFFDHIPAVLDAFERKLAARRSREHEKATADQQQSSAEHGLHRWQQGYNQREVMREWHHLQLCLLEELDHYEITLEPNQRTAITIARHTLVELCSDAVCESVMQYQRLQQAQAAARVSELERALAHLSALERERAEAWRAATHDMRGNLGVVRNATALLQHDEVSGETRNEFLGLVDKSVESLQALLNDLMSLARLDAGHEQRHLESFDAAALLSELCANVQPLAESRQLFLHAVGAASLPVEGDPVKTRRIAQNLLLNALKYTRQGGVEVSWTERVGETQRNWVLCVRDTGPGIDGSVLAPMTDALKSATSEAQEAEREAGEVSAVCHDESACPPVDSASPPGSDSAGEGIGLAIVKRLCELLDASLELETEPGQGTVFRVIFPAVYH